MKKLPKHLKHAKRDNIDNLAGFPELLKPREAATILLIDRRTVERLCAEGRLPGFRVGGQWRLRREDVLALAHSTVRTAHRAA